MKTSDFRAVKLVAELADGHETTIFRVCVGADGKAKDLDPHTLDAIMDTPAIASDFGNMFCSIGGLLLSTVARYNELTAK